MKTALEWLIDKLMKGEFINDTESLIEQAKAMEKEHIENAFYTKEIDEFGDEISFEQYYNETFKSE